MSGLLCIDLPYAYFGCVVKNGRIVEAADIARWMVGKRVADIRIWVKKKNGMLVFLSDKRSKKL